jgi:hypothetical protein
MIVRAPHLQDERLFDCYYSERRGDAPDPPTAEHLNDCDECRRSFDELGRCWRARRRMPSSTQRSHPKIARPAAGDRPQLASDAPRG